MNIKNITNSAINKIASDSLNPSSAQSTKSKDSLGFMDYLNDALKGVNDLQLESDKSSELFMAGLTDNIHQIMIDSEKAELALQFTLQIRNKILDAYNEIMRMQI